MAKLIKRKDGSYSQRGLWDNIRANKGSGKKPTAQMLKQEKKIKADSKAKDGKWIQKASASIKRRGTEGKCTPITKPGCTGKAKALAKTFKKIAANRKKK
jgi:hypothetical protein